MYDVDKSFLRAAINHADKVKVPGKETVKLIDDEEDPDDPHVPDENGPEKELEDEDSHPIVEPKEIEFDDDDELHEKDVVAR